MSPAGVEDAAGGPVGLGLLTVVLCAVAVGCALLLGDGPLALLEVLEQYGFHILMGVLGGREMLMAAGSQDLLIVALGGGGGASHARGRYRRTVRKR